MKSSRPLLLVLLLGVLAMLVYLAIWRHHTQDIPDISTSALNEEALNSDEEIFPGVQKRSVDVSISGQTVHIDFAIVNTSKLSIGIGISSPDVASRDQASQSYAGLTLAEYAALGRYRVVQSGGFLSSWSPPSPLGYVKIQGQEYNRMHDSWLVQGVFCTDGRNFEISRFSSNNSYAAWPSCIQAGPPIILNREIVLDTRRNTGFITKEAHRQSFICKDVVGRLIMGITQDVKLTELAPYLARDATGEGLGCVDAIALNGKGIAGMLYNLPQGPVAVGNVDASLPNAIVVK